MLPIQTGYQHQRWMAMHEPACPIPTERSRRSILPIMPGKQQFANVLRISEQFAEAGQ